jgi:transcriptional regulator with XRE-family HTH domain
MVFRNGRTQEKLSVHDNLHTYQDLAREFGVDRKTIWRWLRAKGLPYFRPSCQTVRFAGSQVRKFFEEQMSSLSTQRDTNRDKVPKKSRPSKAGRKSVK